MGQVDGYPLPSSSLINLIPGGNTTGATAMITSGTLTLAGGPNITLSQNANAISISAAPQATRSIYLQTYADALQTQATLGQGWMMMQPMQIEAYVTATEMDWIQSFSSATATSGVHTVSASFGIYTFANGTSVNLASSGSVSYAMGTSNSNSFTGLRQWSLPINVSASPGDYLCALWMRTSGSLTVSLLGGNSFSFVGSAGAATATSARLYPGLGVYSTSFSTAMPSGVAANVVQGQSGSGRPFDLILRGLGA